MWEENCFFYLFLHQKYVFKSFGGIYPCQGQTFSEILYFNIALKVYYCCKRGSCLPTGGGVEIVPGYIAQGQTFSAILYFNIALKVHPWTVHNW